MELYPEMRFTFSGVVLASLFGVFFGQHGQLTPDEVRWVFWGLIGLGAGNSPFEVEVFKKKYDIPFPLFADEDFTLYKVLGKVRTPYFLVFKIHKHGKLDVVYSKPGGIKDLDGFLKSVMQPSALKSGGAK